MALHMENLPLDDAATPARILHHCRLEFHRRLACLYSSSLRRLELSLLSALRRYRWLIRSSPRFWLMLLYFVVLAAVGFVLMKLLSPRVGGTHGQVRNLDLFFMSVSALTVSSMSTAEMGSLSGGQLVVLAVLMLVGGEVFTSMVDLHVMEAKLGAQDGNTDKAPPSPAADASSVMELGTPTAAATAADHEEMIRRSYLSARVLSAVVFVYLVLAHVAGTVSILLYIAFDSASSARVLRERGVSAVGFSSFLVISSFANAGFVPLDDGMAPFKRAPGLLLLIVPLILAGNTLFPPILRAALRLISRAWLGGETEYILDNHRAIGFQHLLSSKRSRCLLWTVAGFICLQVLVFCWMEWGGAALDGLSTYQKLAAGLFMGVNSRHAGESPFDLSAVSSAVLVMFVVMMYLPPYTTFLPGEDDDDPRGGGEKRRRTSSKLLRSLAMSQISYLSILVILVCITERRKLVEDPINFNVLNIVVEVTSAYGNVGFSTGYGCARRLKREEGSCRDAGYGFVGWWSGGGKCILIVAMFFGRLKKFFMEEGGGAAGAWKLS